MTTKADSHTDIKTGGWIDKVIPAKLRPYAYLARLDRPIGWWLLLLPGWWSIALASGGWQGMSFHAWKLFALFFIGAIVMRAAGCVINDLWDRNIDKRVERTANRPIASGVISSRQGLVFLSILLLVGLGVLLQMNTLTIWFGLSAIPLIVLYPLMKRITYWPQAFLGITFNYGALMGWSAAAGELPFEAIMLYIGCIFWTLGYDTIYAHQDKEDDVMAGVKSTALKFGKHSKAWVFGFYLLAIKLMALTVIATSAQIYIFALLALPLLHFAWQLQSWQPDSPDSSLQIFKSNRNFGLLLLICALL